MYYMLKSGVYRCNDLYIHLILRFFRFNKGFGWFVYTCITYGVKKCLGKTYYVLHVLICI